MNVKIFVVTTWRGPRKQTGVAMWLVEYKLNSGIPVTRQGFVHLPDGTENQAVLIALKDAVGILIKPCVITIYTNCIHVLNVARNFWHTQWEKSGWVNAKGKPVKNAALWKSLIESLKMHSYTFTEGNHEYSEIMQITVQKEKKKNNEQK